MPLDSPSIFISCGEMSGEVLAMELTKQLKNQLPPNTNFFGVGGPRLEKEMPLIAHTDELGVMGLFEVLEKVGHLKILEERIVQFVIRLRPEVAILVDFPGFHFRVAERLHAAGIKVVQYVSPKVWAWGHKRVAKLEKYFDMVLGILPFEQAFFDKTEVNYQYVGCPIKDRMGVTKDNFDFEKYRCRENIVGLLPGSRRSELKYLGEDCKEIVQFMAKKFPEWSVVIPLADNMDAKKSMELLNLDDVKEAGEYLGYPCWQSGNLKIIHGGSLEIMKISRAAICASGTATLECGLAGTPQIVFYRLNWLTYFIAKKRLNVDHVSLLNLVAGKELSREFIQTYECKELCSLLATLLESEQMQKDMIESYAVMSRELGENAAAKAAETISLRFMGHGK